MLPRDRAEKILTLGKAGWPVRAIADQLGHSEPTIRAYLSGRTTPGVRAPRPSLLTDPLAGYCRQRFAEDPHLRPSTLFTELTELGFQASRSTFYDCEGAKQVLGLWIGPTTGESAKFWLSVLSELKGRGVADVCIVCCDGLTGLPDAIGVVWPQAAVQLCVVHLIRASLRYASRKHWAPLAKDLRGIYTAADEPAAAAALEAVAAAWGERYPAIIKLWRAHWAEFTPFLAFPPEVRRVIYTTNLIVIYERPAAEGHPQPRPVPL